MKKILLNSEAFPPDKRNSLFINDSIDNVHKFLKDKNIEDLKSNFYFETIKLNEIDNAPIIAKEYEIIFNTNAEDIQTANAQFETGSSIRSIISYAVGITLLIVSGFGIYNILNMLIYEKMDTIAILKATGFAGSDVKIIFITIALTIGIFGALGGVLFGYLLCTLIDSIPFITASLPTITTYPIDYSLHYYIIAVLFAVITTFLAGWFPAQKASKIDPVIIIRGK